MKSKVLTLFLLLLPLTGFALAKEGEDLQVIGNLIASQERQLIIYHKLQSLMEEFQKEQDRFAQGEQTKELTSQMVLTASQILKLVQDHQLLHLLTPFYIEELKLFSSIAKKRSL